MINADEKQLTNLRSGIFKDVALRQDKGRKGATRGQESHIFMLRIW